MAETKSLTDLLTDELRDLYDAERQLTRALPKLAKAATSDELRTLIEEHLEETVTQVERLERVFEMLEERPRGKHCEGMAGIVEEGSDLIKEDFADAVMDAGIIAAAQRTEHYEIGAYGSVMAWAKVLGRDDIASVLEETLEEEKAADEKLSALAEGTINQAAAAGESDNEDSDEEEETDRTSRRSPARAGDSRAAGNTRAAARTASRRR